MVKWLHKTNLQRPPPPAAVVTSVRTSTWEKLINPEKQKLYYSRCLLVRETEQNNILWTGLGAVARVQCWIQQVVAIVILLAVRGNKLQ